MFDQEIHQTAFTHTGRVNPSCCVPSLTKVKTRFNKEIAVYNRLITIDSKPTNIAIWAPIDEIAQAKKKARNPMYYYLTYKGDAAKTLDIQARPDIEVKKLCLIFPGFNGGPFDHFHLAEALAKAGYWVMSVGCYINPKLKPSDDPNKISLALEDAYAIYPSILDAFTQLTGLPIYPKEIGKIRYLSFSAGVYPLLRAIRKGNCPQWQHQVLLMAPGLSASPGLAELLADAPICSVNLIHSEQDTHPTFGDPLRYLTFFDASRTQLHLLSKGEHFDFIHLPLSIQKSSQISGGSALVQSQHEHAVKQECLAVLDSLIHGEAQ